MKFRVIKQNKKTTQIEIDTQMLEQFQEIIKKIQKEEPKLKRQRKNITIFNRKVVPFFMNQFKKHLENDNDQQQKEILKYLVQLKENKQSKQQKYELGDLVNIFKDPLLSNIQESWKVFLKKHAVQAANDHPRLSQESKEQYQSEIQPLIDQIQQKQPYKLYLSREQRLSKGQQENQSYEDSSEQQTSGLQNQFLYFTFQYSDDISDFMA